MQLWNYELLVIATIAIAVMHKTATFSIERSFALLTKLSRFIKLSKFMEPPFFLVINVSISYKLIFSE